jgi:DNA-binding MarR family transcriptional regulator
MPDYPPLSTQVIGQAESALGALLDPLLAGTGTTFGQWLVLTVTAASGTSIDRGHLIARISGARKVDGATVGAALTELTAAGLVTAAGPVALTDAGRATYHRIRGALEEITARLFDFPAEDLATAGRVLTIVTARANTLLAGQAAAP